MRISPITKEIIKNNVTRRFNEGDQYSAIRIMASYITKEFLGYDFIENNNNEVEKSRERARDNLTLL